MSKDNKMLIDCSEKELWDIIEEINNITSKLRHSPNKKQKPKLKIIQGGLSDINFKDK